MRETGSSQRRGRDLLRPAVLIAMSSVIGIHLIATTVLISRDGVFYIRQARQVAHDLSGVNQQHPPAYPLLVLAAHGITRIFSGDDSTASWVLSGQAAALICRTLALIVLFFVGRRFVGSQRSFLATMILCFLPYAAKDGSDVLREWPLVLTVAAGLWLLLWAMAEQRWYLFGPAGLLAGMSYWLHPACAQLGLYGLLAVLLLPHGMGWRLRSAAATSAFAVGALVPVVSLMVLTYETTARQIQPAAVSSAPAATAPRASPVSQPVTAPSPSHQDAVGLRSAKALGCIARGIMDNLMVFFVLPLLVGFVHRWRHDASRQERILVVAILLANSMLVFTRYVWIEPDPSRRYSMPLVALTIFYVPVGLEVMAQWLANLCGRLVSGTSPWRISERSWMSALAALGIVICLPKLVQPLGAGKEDYRSLARWLHDNTPANAVIAVPDKRMAFYADRKGLSYEQQPELRAAHYVVTTTAESGRIGLPGHWKQVYVQPSPTKDGRRQLAVYSRAAAPVPDAL